MRDLERGFRRLTLLLSTVLALIIWFWFSEVRLRDAERKQDAIIEDAGNYRRFWDCWDANDLCGASKQMVVAELLNGNNEATMVPVPNGGDDFRVLLLVPQVVFPGIDDLREHYDTFGGQVIPGLLRTSDSALEEAARTAKAKCLAFEPYFSEHFVQSKGEMMARGIFEGIPIAAAAFGAVWILFVLFRWVSRGFHGDVVEAGSTSTEADTCRVASQVADGYDSVSMPQEPVRNGAN